jgi:hypothetical protein
MKDEVPRREFLCSLGRWASLGAIGVWLGDVALRRPRPDAAARLALCGECPSIPTCDLPQGVRARQKLGRPATDRPGATKTARLCETNEASGARRT